MLSLIATDAKAAPIPAPDPSKTTPPSTLDTSPESLRTLKKLNRIVVPKIDFEDLDINQALDLLSAKVKQSDPSHAEMKFRIQLPPGPFARLSGPQWEVTGHWKNTTLGQIIGDICDQDSIGWVISKNVVIFYLTYQPETPSGTEAEIRAQKHLENKLNSLIFPRIEFDREDIADAVEYLNKQSKELDPEHVGTKIILRLEKNASSKEHAYKRQLNMNLTDAGLYDVLGYIAVQTNLTFTIYSSEIVIHPQ